MAAHQALPSLGFSRQEHWNGLPFPSPMHESEKWKWSHSVVSDSSRPHGLQPTRLLCPWIFQARIVEWGAIAFSPSHSIVWTNLFTGPNMVQWKYTGAMKTTYLQKTSSAESETKGQSWHQWCHKNGLSPTGPYYLCSVITCLLTCQQLWLAFSPLNVLVIHCDPKFYNTVS